jgi:O-antigen/teichoic acid export membrane protein
MTSPSVSRVPLGHSVSWSMLGNVFFAVCQWGAVVLLARLGSVEVLGSFALALALTAPVFLLASLHLRVIQATDAREQFRFTDYVALRLLASTVALAVVVLLAIVPRDSTDASVTIVFVGLAKAFEGVSDVYYGHHQRLERMDRVARSLMLRGAAGLLGIVVGLRVAGTSSAAAAGMATAWCAVALLHDVKPGPLRAFAREAGAAFRWSNASRVLALARLSLPLGVALMLVSLQANIPRYVVEAHGGNKALGVFAALSSFLAVGSVLVNALGQSAAPGMARRFAGGPYSNFLRLATRVSAAAVGIGAAGWLVAVLAGPGLLDLVLGAQYRPYCRELSWLMAAGVLSGFASALGYALIAARQIHIQVPMFLGVCFTVAAASYVLVPQHGILGAAWALGAGFSVQVLVSLGVLWKSAP